MVKSEATPTCPIRFTSDEGGGVLPPHHDVLVISLTIVNCLMNKILINNGSSTNIIFMQAYKGLGLDETRLMQKSIPFVEFIGELKQTVWEGMLLVYAKGFNRWTKFHVLDWASAYNEIMGHLWIWPGFIRFLVDWMMELYWTVFIYVTSLYSLLIICNWQEVLTSNNDCREECTLIIVNQLPNRHPPKPSHKARISLCPL